jgi:hypothetical protein
MPNVQNISFSKTGADADLQAQQIALQRQQMMADMLRSQAAQPIDQQVVSGRVVPISGFQAIAKVLQSGLGAYAQKKGDEQQQELGAAKAKRSADALRALFSPQGAAAPADAPLSSIPQQSVPGSQMSDPAAATITPEQQRAMSAYQIDPELGRSMITNLLNQTEEQKNNAAQGIDQRLMGALKTARARKEGIIEYQPGTTSQDLATGMQRFQPKLGEGIMPTADGGAQAIPGYGPAAAGIAGQTAQAQAAANAGYQLKEITAPDGSTRMVTAQQAAQMAGGQPQGAPQAPPGTQGPPNQGFPAGTQVPAQMPGGPQARLDILNQERQQIMALPDTDPRKAGDLAAITREIQGAGGAQQQAQPGIPMQSEAQRAAQVGEVENQVALDKNLRLNAQSPEAQQKIIDAQSVLGLVKAAQPLLDTATGSTVGALRDSAMSMVGRDTDASKAAAQLGVIGGQLVSKMPKMSGPQSDKDVMLYKEMAGRIGDPSVTSGNKGAALQVLEQLTEKYLSQNQGSLPAAAARAVQGAAPTAIDDLLKKYGGK